MPAKQSNKPEVRYRALADVSPTGTTQVIRRGGMVDVSHLTPDQIEMLVDMGAIERLTVTPDAPAREEV